MAFGDYLKSLRALRGFRPEDLAAEAGLHVSTVYKAEKGDQVRWDTVKQLYSRLCMTDAQRAELMLRWAMSLDPGYTKAATARPALRAVLAASELDQKEEATAISGVMATLSQTDKELLWRWCELFATSEPTRGMARAWLEALRPEASGE